MTYRSDHDAALARVDALEAENARLQRKLKARPRMYTPAVATPERRRYWPLAALIPVIGVGAAALTTEKPRVHAPAVEHVAHGNLEMCARPFEVKRTIDVSETGPRGRALSRTWIARTERTDCRAEIRYHLQHAVISDHERRALTQWAAAEDVLANEVSLITTYYADSPNADLYADAHQLWLEYDRAYDRREDAIHQWRASR